MGKKVSRWNQSSLCATIMGQNVCNHALIHWQWPDYQLMFIAMLVFQVSKNLVVNDTAYSVDRLVFWWSQSGLYEKVSIHGVIQ